MSSATEPQPLAVLSLKLGVGRAEKAPARSADVTFCCGTVVVWERVIGKRCLLINCVVFVVVNVINYPSLTIFLVISHDLNSPIYILLEGLKFFNHKLFSPKAEYSGITWRLNPETLRQEDSESNPHSELANSRASRHLINPSLPQFLYL